MKFSETCYFTDKYGEEETNTLKVENWVGSKVALTFNGDNFIRVDGEALIMAIRHCLESGGIE